MTFMDPGCMRCGRGIPSRREGTGYCSQKCEDKQIAVDRANQKEEWERAKHDAEITLVDHDNQRED